MGNSFQIDASIVPESMLRIASLLQCSHKLSRGAGQILSAIRNAILVILFDIGTWPSDFII